MRMYIYVYVHTCVFYIFIYVYAYTHVYIYIHRPAWMIIRIHMYEHIYIDIFYIDMHEGTLAKFTILKRTSPSQGPGDIMPVREPARSRLKPEVPMPRTPAGLEPWKR